MRKILKDRSVFSIIYKLVIFWFLIGYIILPIGYTLIEAVTLDDQRDWTLFAEYFMDAKNQEIIFNTLKLLGYNR
ncbi:hypothetical protein ABE547_10275 [Dorea sp. YH-dor226]|uniref:hypothetical protein n=1 Tax=Dorea sp. YH-dor226 TaxID=3151119 RepID=UPI0032423E87